MITPGQTLENPVTGERFTFTDTASSTGGELLGDAIAQRLDLFITGELRHHDAIAAGRAGVNLICTLHSVCERPALSRLAERLRAALPAMTFDVSRADRDPFAIL